MQKIITLNEFEIMLQKVTLLSKLIKLRITVMLKSYNAKKQILRYVAKKRTELILKLN